MQDKFFSSTPLKISLLKGKVKARRTSTRTSTKSMCYTSCCQVWKAKKQIIPKEKNSMNHEVSVSPSRSSSPYFFSLCSVFFSSFFSLSFPHAKHKRLQLTSIFPLVSFIANFLFFPRHSHTHPHVAYTHNSYMSLLLLFSSFHSSSHHSVFVLSFT